MKKGIAYSVTLCLMVWLAFLFPAAAFAYNGDTIVYVTKTGSKYHKGSCSYLQTKIEITLEDAVANGYEPCSRCSPPRLDKSVSKVITLPTPTPAPSISTIPYRAMSTPSPTPREITQTPSPTRSPVPYPTPYRESIPVSTAAPVSNTEQKKIEDYNTTYKSGTYIIGTISVILFISLLAKGKVENRLEERLKQQTTNYEKAVAERDTMEAEAKRLKAERDRMEDETKRLKAENNRLRLEVSRIEREAECLNEENSKLKANVRRMEDEVNASEAEANRLEAELILEKRKIADVLEKSYLGKPILSLCNAPKNCSVGNDGLPKSPGSEKWGAWYTFYINETGTIYHKKNCQHAASCFPVNAYDISKYKCRPCRVCCPSVPDLGWYQEYLRIKSLLKKYDLD